LRKWGIINGNKKEKITRIVRVRNQFAHKWNEKDVIYGTDNSGNDATIIQNIEKFRNDAENMWINLIDKYMIEEEKQIGRLIAKLEDPNTINVPAQITKTGEIIQEQSSSGSENYFPSI